MAHGNWNDGMGAHTRRKAHEKANENWRRNRHFRGRTNEQQRTLSGCRLQQCRAAFIIDNLDAILTAENMQTQMQGAPWTKEHDDCLIDLYKKSVPVSEIAITLKRSTSAVRGRLKKLGFDA